MNGDWFIQIILVLTSALVSVVAGYLLGIRRQKKQILREHITSMVQDEYPELFAEMKRNSDTLDNFLENPNETFQFPRLDDIYNRGMEEFVKRHHRDLFLLVDSHKNILLPKFHELNTLVRNLMDRMFDVWEAHLRECLPREVAETSRGIAVDLIKSINPNYVFSDLLNERDKEIRNKLEKSFWDRTSHIYRDKAKRKFVIRGEQKVINFDEISESLIEKAKPGITDLKELYKELKKQSDIQVRGKFMPLLQEYISNPI